MAAGIVARIMEVKKEVIRESLSDFENVEHRLEFITKVHGIEFINDSKATTMESVRTAVEGIYPILQKKEKLWLLLGGKDKNLPWEELRILQKFPQLRVAYFGQCGDRAKQGASIPGNLYPMLKSAVQAVTEEVSQGDIVLLSPGGTSWDEFKNFEERGQKFREYVESSAKR
jgi:UDP-N-acetylmuramoylalanine--D-glutamate ligase